MPRRSAPVPQALLESVLSPAERAAVHGQAAALGIPPERWSRVPALARVWECIAAVRLAERIREANGAGEKRALLLATSRLGLSADTVQSRLRRFFLDAYDEGA